MIRAFALEPQLVATWGRRDAFRFIHDKFGLGTARVLLELPAFKPWKRKVYEETTKLALSQEDMKRVEELFRLFGEHRYQRKDTAYDGLISWLENAEREHQRKPFAGILATQNPRTHAAVIVAEQIGSTNSCWVSEAGASPVRTPEALALTLTGMLTNCRQLHLVDPHFGPENLRHRKVLEAFMGVLADNGVMPDIVRVHCSAKSNLALFEAEATKMASRLPNGLSVQFVRWRQRVGGERLHNRYVLTDVGGVSLGVGLDAGNESETDDVLLLPRRQFELRWNQYAGENGVFDCVDRPSAVIGTHV